MNILFICNEYPPYPHGGIGTVTQTIAEGIQSRGHTAIIAGFYNTIDSFSSSKVQGVLVYRLPQSKFIKHDFYSRIMLYRMVKKIIAIHSIDVLEVPDYLGLLAFWPKLSIPSVLRLHGSATYLSSESLKIPSKKYFCYESRTLKKCSHIIAVSKSIAEKTKRIFKLETPIEIIYNSICVNYKGDETLQDRELNKIVFTGTLMKIKGVFQLFEAWPEVIQKNPNARLHIFGKDSLNEGGLSVKALLLQSLMPQFHETVVFHGHVSRDQILNELMSASVAVFPSMSETFGLAPVEAMAQGCPTIFTKLASGPEIINDGENGLLVDPLNPKEIAEAINKILEDRGFADRIGCGGRKHVESRFSNGIVLEQNEKMFQKVVDRFKLTISNRSSTDNGPHKIDFPHG